MLLRPLSRLLAWARRERWLLGLLAVGTVIGYAGLAHEVGTGYYADEGHYLHHARLVLDGEVFTRSFVYPHLLYYLDAGALWLAGLAPAPVAAAASAVFGVTDPDAVDWLVLRWLGAALGVGTLVPVFLLARRLAGPAAAVLAGALQIVSVRYHEGFQVNTCDVPSAFFAACCLYFVGRLVDRESLRDYLLAGVASGLAAGTKYPAGVVAIGIVGVWLAHRLREIRGRGAKPPWAVRLGLVWGGAVSLAAFLATNPSWLVYPDAALSGPRGVFFGVHQYAEGGWKGVTPPSNTAYYLEQLRDSFGLGVVLLAAVGVFALAPEVRRRLLWLAPYPVAFFALIASMNMVVVRNLFPLIPALAVALGVAASGLAGVARGWPRAGRRLAAAAVLAAALVWPALATVRQTVALANPSTREVMAVWVREHVPRGAGLLTEAYAPDFPADEFRVISRRFAFRIPEARFADPRYDYLLVAGHAFYRFFRPENRDEFQADWYAKAFAAHTLVHRVEPGATRLGPELRLYRIEGRPWAPRRRLVLTPGDAFPSHPSMTRDGGLRFTQLGRTAVFRADLDAGVYRLRIVSPPDDPPDEGDGTAAGAPAPGSAVRVRDLENRLVAEAAVRAGHARLELPAGRLFLELELPPRSRLSQLELRGANLPPP